jgi:hypothetical protein
MGELNGLDPRGLSESLSANLIFRCQKFFLYDLGDQDFLEETLKEVEPTQAPEGDEGVLLRTTGLSGIFQVPFQLVGFLSEGG